MSFHPRSNSEEDSDAFILPPSVKESSKEIVGVVDVQDQVAQPRPEDTLAILAQNEPTITDAECPDFRALKK